MKRTVGLTLVALLAALLPDPVAGQGIDPFYTQLLDDGIRSSERGDYQGATEELRIAAFGLMEAPQELARALAYLAAAQNQTGDSENLVGTLRRLAEVETRFGALSSADLDSTVRGALDLAARSVLAEGELHGSPLLVQQPEALVVESPTGPAEPATRPAYRARLCISWTAGDECQQPGVAAATPPPSSADPAATTSVAAPGHQPEELEALDRLSRLAAGKAGTKKLHEGFEEARALADLHPDWLAAQRVAGLLAARSASYAEAVTYYRRSGEPGADKPVELFYLSVALYETDAIEEAAATLRRALPGLEQNREIRRYVRQILPAEAQG